MLNLGTIALLVNDYDEAIKYFVDRLGFYLVEDTRISNEKRWVRVAPGTNNQLTILLAKAVTDEQRNLVGKQGGGRVFLFLETTDFDKTYMHFIKSRVNFIEEPRTEIYGKVIVFKDLYGNKWDLVESKNQTIFK